MWYNGLHEIVSQVDLGEDWIRMSRGVTSEPLSSAFRKKKITFDF